VNRSGLTQALAALQAGDVLVVWRLDRLGRSLSHLITVVETLHARDVGFRSVQEAMDTTTPGGTLIFHIFGALAEFERALIRERVRAGLTAARARGRVGGRPRKLTPHEIQMAQTLLADPTMTTVRVADALHVSRATLYRALKRTPD
jgi:DNA invertase Pin-like site-specific DNA recombinase